ncbi:hypothetical protein GCM10010510_11000 [Streptomyces anandii JCM 4720]|nr:hypothetical protein GCM10010510_11000 [Streptomyces anandii JCM 4720]
MREADVLRPQPGPAGAQELAQLGTAVQPAGVLGKIGLVHMSSIPGPTHSSLTPPVVGTASVRKGVTWVNAVRRGTLEERPAEHRSGADNRS